MPKIRTNRGAAKRFARTGGGRIKCRHSHKRHILTKKSQKRKRHLRGNTLIAKADEAAVEKLIPTL